MHEYSQCRRATHTADEDGATSCDTSISFSFTILILCTWPFASILFTVHPTRNGQYSWDVKNGCNSVWSLIRLWMYVKKNKHFVVMNGKALGRSTSEQPLYLYLHRMHALPSCKCFSLILFQRHALIFNQLNSYPYIISGTKQHLLNHRHGI